MKNVHMAVIHDEEAGTYGDCFRACVASVLGVESGAVPHFLHDGGGTFPDDWMNRFVQWAESRGFIPYEFSASIITPPGYYIATGKSPRFDVGHSVVMRNGRVVWDPHPSRDGIEGVPWSVMIFVIIDADAFYEWKDCERT